MHLSFNEKDPFDMNKFFTTALSKAIKVGQKRERLLLLASQLGEKLRKITWESINADVFKTKLMTFGRLSKAYALGHYREIHWKSFLIIVASIIYFLNPFDLLPDIIPITGFTDDFSILAWAFNTVNGEVNKFLEWEESQISVS